MPQREALQVALQEGGNSLMHESFHLVVLLRRAVAEIGEKVGARSSAVLHRRG